MKFGVMSTPALVIDGAGQVLGASGLRQTNRHLAQGLRPEETPVPILWKR